jgi:hypothetical protein
MLPLGLRSDDEVRNAADPRGEAGFGTVDYRDNLVEVYQESTRLSSQVIVSHFQSGGFGAGSDSR